MVGEDDYYERLFATPETTSVTCLYSSQPSLETCPFSEMIPTFGFSEAFTTFETFPSSEASVLHSQPDELLLDSLNQIVGYENTSFSADTGTQLIKEKITSAFSKVTKYGGLIALFWAPVTTGGKCLLSTAGQPPAVNSLDNCINEYMLRSVEYEYNFDANNKPIEIKHGDPPMVIFSGPPTSAFLNRLPELIVDTSANQLGPLVHYAFKECGLRTFYMLPICFSSERSSCVGVVECSTTCYKDLQIYDKINMALKGEGLSVLNVQDRIPYKTTNGLQLVRDEIQASLKNLCETHDIGLAQVWIPYEKGNHVPFLSSLENSQPKRNLALKLTGHCADRHSAGFQFSFKEYYDASDIAPLQMEEENVLKTLQDFKPRFCKNISKLNTDMLMAWPIPDDPDANSSALTICMRCNRTNDDVYVFEFIWLHNSNKVISVDAILSTVKRSLPHFNLVFGDALHVIDVENFTDSEIKKFKSFQGKKLLPISRSVENRTEQMIMEPLKKKSSTSKICISKHQIMRQYGNTLEQAAANIRVSRSTLKRNCSVFKISWPKVNAGKRKVHDLYNQSDTKEKVIGAVQDPSPVNRDDNWVIIKVFYEGDMIKFRSTLDVESIRKEVVQRLDLVTGTYNLEYQNEHGDMIPLASEQAMNYVIKWTRTSGSNNVRLLLQRIGKTGQNSKYTGFRRIETPV